MRLLSFIFAAVAASCAAAPPPPGTVAEAVESLDGRAPEVAVVQAALELADPSSLGIALPREEDLADPARDAHWHGAAYAYSPTVRDARAAALAALARESSAGAPGPLMVRLVDHEFGGDDTLAEAVATVDLMGLLGLGQARAAGHLARAESLLSVGALGAALWNVRFDVDLARVEIELARALSSDLEQLAAEASQDLKRVDILEARGRLGEAAGKAARGQVSATRAAAEAARFRLEGAKARLARTSGVTPQAVAGAPSWDLLQRPGAGRETIAPDHPALRVARLALALAEARLRAQAANAVPGLRFGPHLGFPSGDLNPLRLGGVMGLSVPIPSSYRGRVDAAAVERDRALERYAEAVLALRTDHAAATGQFERSSIQERSAAEAERATESVWNATRSSFQNGRVGIGDWVDAVERRRSAIQARVAATGARARAALDLERACGPVADRAMAEGGEQ